MIDKIKSILNGREFQSAVGETALIKFQPEVIQACKANYCGMYGKRWTCPPAVGDLDRLKNKYNSFKNFFVFSTLHTIEDSFDFEGMMEARKAHDDIQREVVMALGDSVDVLGVGGCSICENCTYPDSPCRFPQKAKPAIEACGINVVELCRDVNINYTNGENTVTFFTAVFFDRNDNC